jgi:hypothetical protein
MRNTMLRVWPFAAALLALAGPALAADAPKKTDGKAPKSDAAADDERSTKDDDGKNDEGESKDEKSAKEEKPAKDAKDEKSAQEEKPAKDAKDEKSAKDDADDSDDDIGGPITIKIPSWFQAQGYSLRIGRDLLPLEGAELRTERTTKRERIELIAHDNRLLDQDKTYVDDHLFEDLSPTQFKAGLFIGGVRTNGRGFRDLLQTGNLAEVSLDFFWQPTALGIAGSIATISAEKDHDGDVTSTYSENATRVAATYELAPFGKSSLWRRWHLVGLAGLEMTRQSIEITDDVVTIDDQSRSVGPWGAVDVQYPLGSFWLSGRLSCSYHVIEFKDLDFKSKTVMTGVLLGGLYAF